MTKKKKIESAESVDLIQDEVKEESFEYIVNAGDGIKKIARKLNKDYKKIIEDNNLEEPFELYINQKLIIK